MQMMSGKSQVIWTGGSSYYNYNNLRLILIYLVYELRMAREKILQSKYRWQNSLDVRLHKLYSNCKKPAPKPKLSIAYWLQDSKWGSSNIGWPTDKDFDLYLYWSRVQVCKAIQIVQTNWKPGSITDSKEVYPIHLQWSSAIPEITLMICQQYLNITMLDVLRKGILPFYIYKKYQLPHFWWFTLSLKCLFKTNKSYKAIHTIICI